MRHRNSRDAFTLVECVVAAAIAGILAALLLSATAKARAAAERLRCQSNLRQIALATHHYHDAFGRFPPSVHDDMLKDYWMSWLTRLLPYLDQDNLWAAAQRARKINPNPFSTPHYDICDRPMPIFSCPLDDRNRVAWQFGPNHRVALTSYLGNSGLNYADEKGVIVPQNRVSIVAIRDGTSQTLLAGERPPSFDVLYGWWYAAAGQSRPKITGSLDYVMGAKELNVSHHLQYKHCGPGPFAYREGDIDDPCSVFSYWSLHRGGAHFAMCDGSVHFLPHAAGAILPALATRAGGESVAID